ncbi:MAG: nucleotidyl transferase AbiEii/AbiGii toxin family protein [Ardenticatenaceae bacterium]|nr:nucleotidyl transferase AbiEii/AbiGii toxin family protein [Ardenticatenaceae bacterium]MCB9446019.1 nucleotidyl transferase AbiEii/AbiGii toxin family protein [Ardenticatenaceae bacterium]
MSPTEQHSSFHDPLESLGKLLSHFGDQGVVIGGIAVSLLGEARFTEDLDAMVLLSVEEIPHFLTVAQKEGIEPRISNAEDFARQNRVLLLRHTCTQTDIDVSLGILPFEQEMVERSIVHEVDASLQIRLPTPEDLIIMKAVAHRPKDLLDIQGIIQSHPKLDQQRIQFWVSQFAELLERPELWEDIAGWL